MALLKPGDRFPGVTMAMVDGDTMELPGALAGSFGVVLFYRGSWCPYCNAQLRAFQRASENLIQVGARVVALSVDDEATTKELVARFDVPRRLWRRCSGPRRGHRGICQRRPDVPAVDRVRA